MPAACQNGAETEYVPKHAAAAVAAQVHETVTMAAPIFLLQNGAGQRSARG